MRERRRHPPVRGTMRPTRRSCRAAPVVFPDRDREGWWAWRGSARSTRVGSRVFERAVGPAVLAQSLQIRLHARLQIAGPPPARPESGHRAPSGVIRHWQSAGTWCARHAYSLRHQRRRRATSGNAMPGDLQRPRRPCRDIHSPGGSSQRGCKVLPTLIRDAVAGCKEICKRDASGGSDASSRRSHTP